jgi:hypothetical protein
MGIGDSIVNERGMNGRRKERKKERKEARGTKKGRKGVSLGRRALVFGCARS